MQHDAGHAGPLGDPAELVAVPLGVNRGAQLVDHDVSARLVRLAGDEALACLRGAESAERGEQVVVEGERSHAVARLRLLLDDPALDEHPRPADRQRAGVEVDVVPPQPEHLAAAQPVER
jgi:hypothetical protein